MAVNTASPQFCVKKCTHVSDLLDKLLYSYATTLYLPCTRADDMSKQKHLHACGDQKLLYSYTTTLASDNLHMIHMFGCNPIVKKVSSAHSVVPMFTLGCHVKMTLVYVEGSNM